MAVVDDLLAAPCATRLELAAGDGSRTPVRAIALLEEMHAIERAPRGAFAVLTRAASAGLGGYQFDTAVRMAAAGGLAALALVLPEDAGLPPTAASIADRSELAIVQVPPETDLGVLCVHLAHELERDSGRLWSGLRTAIARLDQGDLTDPANVAGIVADALGTPVSATAGDDDDLQVEVVADGHVEAVLSAPRRGEPEDTATQLALALGAALSRCAIEADRRRTEAPIRSGSLLLAQLILGSPGQTEALADRARDLQLPVDGWHVVVRLEWLNVEQLGGADELAQIQIADQLTRMAVQEVRSYSANWYAGQVETALLLVRMHHRRPSDADVDEAATATRRVVERLHSRFPGLELRGGVGQAHPGVSGLRASAAEARAAAARAGLNGVGVFDESRVHRMLSEWYASDSVRDSARELLAPLDALGPARAATAIETLRTYLDTGGSLAQTGKALHLHRNAVAHRMRRILDLLDGDLDDPDCRLTLHLACRARELE